MDDKLDGPNKTAHNEIQKLRANFCNGCGIAAAAAGIIIPLVKQFQEPADKWIGWVQVALFGVMALSLALFCHSIGRIYILKIKE
jgi:uncharacterized membrane protein YjfL (UPF0719 family)